MTFLRHVDINRHDPALSTSQKNDFVNTLHCLFLDGFILGRLEDAPRSAGESAPDGSAGKTLTQIAYEQLSPMRTFYYGHKTKVLWNGSAKEDAKAALRSLQDVVRAATARVKADLYDGDPIMLCDVFNLEPWDAARAEIRLGGAKGDAARRSSQLRLGRLKNSSCI